MSKIPEKIKILEGEVYMPSLSHTKDPQTSFDAADKMIKSGKLSRQERLILITIEDFCDIFGKKGFTPKEIVKWNSRFDYYTIQRRLSGLRNKGKIDRLNTKGGIYIENKGQKPLKRNGCCVWRLR